MGQAPDPGAVERSDEHPLHSRDRRPPAPDLRQRQDPPDRMAAGPARRDRACNARPRKRLRRCAEEGSRQVSLRGGHDRDELRGGGGEVRAQAPTKLDAAHERANADDGAARAQLHRARAEGRGADHRAVELPAVHGRRAAGGRRGRRKLRDHEAVGDHRRTRPLPWQASCRAISTRTRLRSSRVASRRRRNCSSRSSTTSSTPATSASRRSS